MKKTFMTMVALLMTVCAMGQAVWEIVKVDGTKIVLPESEVEYVAVKYHEYVDLGLPSGTLWATMNIGATSPEEYGTYFAWGETEPKSIYDWSTYKYCTTNGAAKSMTKYCNNGTFGTVDNKTELEPDDDAAYVIWGADWRIPSIAQWEELVNSNYTTVTYIIPDDDAVVYVYGLQITSKSNGKSIFLPAAGELVNDSKNYSLPYAGDYWSRTLDTAPDAARNLYFSYGGTIALTYGRERYWGVPVRAVRNQ